MDPDLSVQRLLQRSFLAILVGAVLVTLCYFFVDRPVAFFVHDQGFAHFPGLKELTYPPPYLEFWAPLVLVALAVRRSWGPFHRWEQTLLAACIALPIAETFRETLSYGFGRYWPKTWVENNPSLIQDGAYGFHPFHSGPIYGSFPSGHTARIVAIAAVVWIAYPRWRWACVVLPGMVVVGLVGMNYHFVGDAVGGGFVGGLVGTYTAYFCGLAGCSGRARSLESGEARR